MKLMSAVVFVIQQLSLFFLLYNKNYDVAGAMWECHISYIKKKLCEEVQLYPPW